MPQKATPQQRVFKGSGNLVDCFAGSLMFPCLMVRGTKRTCRHRPDAAAGPQHPLGPAQPAQRAARPCDRATGRAGPFR